MSKDASYFQMKQPPESKQKAPAQKRKGVDNKTDVGVYTCPAIVRGKTNVSDATLKHWALAILNLIDAGVITYSWMTLARLLDRREIAAVKLSTPQQSFGLSRACGRLGVDVIQRQMREETEPGEVQTVYCVMRKDSVDQVMRKLGIGGVYGEGASAARRLIEEGSVRVGNEELASRAAASVRKLIRVEFGEVYREYIELTQESLGQGRRGRVVYVRKDEETGEFTLEIAAGLQELFQAHFKNKK